MLTAGLAPIPHAATGGPPAATNAALAASSVPNALTAQAAPPAIGAPVTGNRRQPSPTLLAAPEETTPALIGPGGLQAASQRLVQRDFGSSSAFLAQLIDQTEGDAAQADIVKYQPSQAGKPSPPPPSFAPVAAESAPPLPDASAPVAPPVAIPAANQNNAAPVPGLNLGEMAVEPPVPLPRPVRAETSPAAERPALRAKAGGAYQSSQQRLIPAHKGGDALEAADLVT